MTKSFLSQSFRADRADALIQQMQSSLGGAGVRADFAILLADEACGQALIERCRAWIAQEIGTDRIWVLPVLGSEEGGAQIQVLQGHLAPNQSTNRFGPIEDWSFDSVAAGFSSVSVGASLISVDPRMPFTPQRLQLLNEAGGGFLMGAIGAPSGAYTGPSGLACSLDLTIMNQVFPGVERMDGEWTITAASGQIVHEIDNRPALSVLTEVAGDILSRKLEQIPSFIHLAFPVSSASPEDFLVRKITGMGTSSQTFSLDDEVLPGMPLSFARRNGRFVRDQIDLGLKAMRSRLGASEPKAAIYLSDHRRETDFETPHQEADLIKEAMGNVPLILGNVEGLISHNRLYQLASQLIFVL